MTIEDFIHSLIPHGFSTEEAKGKLDKEDYKSFFDLVDVDKDGLISLPEYILFSTLLSIPEDRVETAFKMFDLDGNGRVDYEEFFNLLEVMKQKSSPTRSLKELSKDAHLTRLLFGERLDKTLSFSDFRRFLRALRENVNSMEFDLYDPARSGFISAEQFALSIIVYCSKYQILLHLKRLEQVPAALKRRRVSRRQFLDFNQILRSAGDIDYALELFSQSSHDLEKRDFERAVRTVTGVELSAAQVDIIFSVFDSDGDGKLQKSDLVEALDYRYSNAGGKRKEVRRVFDEMWGKVFV